MKVRGQRFYNMQTHEKVKFALPDVESVIVEECEISTVDTETNRVLGTSILFLCIVLLNDGTFVSTKPLRDGDYCQYIASTLVDRIERWTSGS